MDYCFASTFVPHLPQNFAFSSRAVLHLAHLVASAPVPHFVQIKVTVLRDVTPFVALIDQQNKTATPPALSNEAFDRWVDNVSSVYLNIIPVRWDGKTRNSGTVDAEQSTPGGSM